MSIFFIVMWSSFFGRGKSATENMCSSCVGPSQRLLFSVREFFAQAACGESTWKVPPFTARVVAALRVHFAQAKSTSKPSRARGPLILPFGQTEGRAGSRWSPYGASASVTSGTPGTNYSGFLASCR